MSEEEIINKWFEKNMCVSFKKFTENWEEQQELTNYLQQENSQLKQRIEKAIEYCNLYTKLNAKELLEILKGDE